MRITESKLRRTIRRVIKESIPIYAGSKDTPDPSQVEKWANALGFECYDYRGYPYPTICQLEFAGDRDIHFVIEAHTNMSLGTCFIKASVYEYTEENPRGNPPVHYLKDKNVHSLAELEEIYEDFINGYFGEE